MKQAGWVWRLYVGLFYLFLFLPLAVVAVFAFNASTFPSPPWKGSTLDWFIGDGSRFGKAGILRDSAMLDAIGTSVMVALAVTVLTVLLGTLNAFLLERRDFPGKRLLSVMMLWPLVIPGVILGISILAFFSRLANGLEAWTGWELDPLRPGLPLVVLGQLSFILTIATLIIGARLRKFDRTQEEAARDLGAGPVRVFTTILLPFLAPALIGAGVVAFLMSFENFNTTLILVGADAPLPIHMYGQMREGATPAINAVSLLLMLGSGVLASLVAFGAAGRK